MKKLLSLLLVLVLAISLFSVPAQAASLPFTDVSSSQWYYKSVVYAYESGLMEGTTPTKFGPNSSLTREQAVSVVGRLVEKFGYTIPSGTTTLSDVISGAYYYKYVCWAINNNLIDHPSGKFGIGQPINRQDICYLLYNACNKAGFTIRTLVGLPLFSDASSISSIKKPAVEKCARGKIVSGTDGKFNPLNNLTRAQLAEIITNFAAYHKNDYAYSIGCNHGTTGSGNQGDFTGNVQTAKSWYSNVSGLTSLANTQPTGNFLINQLNPSSFKILGSSVLFLNGHASPMSMIFNHQNMGGSYDTGVACYQTNNYACIPDIDMRGVKLVSFVGCNTGTGSSNLCTNAIARGANTAVGFVNNINSRNTYGPNWLSTYNNYLSQNFTVEDAIDRADAFYPNSNLSYYHKIYGSRLTRLNVNSAYLSNSASTQAVKDQEAKMNLISCAIPVNLDEEIADAPLEKYQAELKEIISEIEKVDLEFDVSNYRLSYTELCDEEDVDRIRLTYCMGENQEIETNKVYIVNVENGTAVKIHFVNRALNKSENEDIRQTVSYRKNDYVALQRDKSVSSEELRFYESSSEWELNETNEKFYFDMDSGVLKHIKGYFYINHDMGDIVADVATETVIE